MMLVRRGPLPLLLIAVACSSPLKKPASAPPPAAEPTEASEPAVAEPPDEPATPAPAALSDDLTTADAPEAAPDFDIEVWAMEQGVTVDLSVDRCELARVGDRPESTIWCYSHQDLESGHVLYFRLLYSARNKRMKKLLDSAVAAGPMASSEASAEEASDYVRLDVEVTDDRRSIALVDSSSAGCQRARDAIADELSHDPKAAKERRQLVDRVCKSRGRYRWQGAGLRRVAGPPR